MSDKENIQFLAIKVNDKDNVATLFSNDVTAGSIITVRDKAGIETVVETKSDIPYGHKIALCEIYPKEPIFKYGEALGAATKKITVGEHVHIHNLSSMRARGDLEGEK